MPTQSKKDASLALPVNPVPATSSSRNPISAMRFDLVTLRLFASTAELGNVTRAAAALHLVPAAASRRIRDLEEQLGLALFVRLPHGMTLTDAGRTMLAHARSMLHAVERMQDDAAAFLHGGRGIVRIAACTSAVLQFLPDDIRACNAANANIHIDLQEMNSEGVVRAVQRGVADLGVFESSVSAVELPTLHYRDDRLCVVTLGDHPLARDAERGIPVTIDSLFEHELIGLTEGASVTITLGRLAARAEKPLRMRIRVGSFDSMAAMITAGIGIGLMPEAVAKLIANAPHFHHLPIGDDWATRRFVLCHQPRQSLALAADSVIASLTGVSLPPR
jgi:DNA-binding transcriptional LysR family regulator